ncbi:uncharacterized protein O3C94_009642 isoform 2-T3 [Discoglossus pictus]
MENDINNKDHRELQETGEKKRDYVVKTKENQIQNKQTDMRPYRAEKRFLCIDCGKSFTRKSSLIVHQRIHTGEKLYMCTECGKRFGLKSSLVRHLRTHTPKTLNICPDCGKCFSRYSSLFQHQKVHRREKRYKCSQCEKSFSRAAQLVAHQRKHKGEKLYERTECGENVTDCSRSNSTEDPHTCQECGKSFPELSSLKRHRRAHTGAISSHKNTEEKSNSNCRSSNGVKQDISELGNKTSNSWKTCKTNVRKGNCAVSKEQNSLERYNQLERRLHSGEKCYLCIDCGKSFTRKSSLIVHQRIHTGEKLYMCTECGKRFGLKSSLVRHLRTHTPKTLNICPDCGKCFSRYSSLFQHQKVHRREKRYKCSQCEKSFSRAAQLVAHQRKHKGEKLYERTECGENVTDCSRSNSTEDPHTCQECGKSFPELSSLKRHRRTHTGESCPRNNVYNQCHTHPHSVLGTENGGLGDNIYVKPNKTEDKLDSVLKKPPGGIDSSECVGSCWKGSDRVNRSDHSHEKRYLCMDCGKSFTRKSSLIVHQRIHTGEKLYMCTECGKRFGLKSSLVRHLGTHTPKTLNICPDCGKCFSRYSSLFQHQKVHRREKRYKCSQCEKSFTLASQLVAHQRKHKGEKFCEQTVCGENFIDYYGNRNTEEAQVCKESVNSFRVGISPTKHQKILRGDGESLSSSEAGESPDWAADGISKSFHRHRPGKRNVRSNSISMKTSEEETRNTKYAQRYEGEFSIRTKAGEKSCLCIDCGKSFTRKSSLIVHQRIHTGEKLYMCMECGKRFGLKSSLVRHLRTHSGQTLSICSQCGIYFSRYSDLMLHLEIHVGQTAAVSKSNPDDDSSLQAVQDTMPTLDVQETETQNAKNPEAWGVDPMNTPENRYKAETKAEQVQMKPYLQLDHEKLHLHQENLLENLQDQESLHRVPEKLLIPKDQESMQIKQEGSDSTCTANRHANKNEEFPSYPYSLDWGVEFEVSKPLSEEENSRTVQNKRKENLAETSSHEAKDNRDFGAKVWGKSSQVNGRDRSADKRFLCMDCGKSFTRKSSLIVHQRIHTGEKLYMCTECGKRFGLKSSLVRHYRTHSGEYFTCVECGKTFREYSKFTQHQTSHNGEWPYTEPLLNAPLQSLT